MNAGTEKTDLLQSEGQGRAERIDWRKNRGSLGPMGVCSFPRQITLPTVLDFAGNKLSLQSKKQRGRGQLTRVFGERRTECLELRYIRSSAGRMLRLVQDRIKCKNATRMLLARVGL
jgi:hypothetical protein